jgi:hypothetical protein
LAFWPVPPPAAPVTTVFDPEDPICTGAQDARSKDTKIKKAVRMVLSLIEIICDNGYDALHGSPSPKMRYGLHSVNGEIS